MKQTIQPNESLVNGQSEATKSETDGISRVAASKRNVVVLTGAKHLQFEVLRQPLRVIARKLGRRNGGRKHVSPATEKSRITNVERCVRVSLRDGLELPSIRHLDEPHVANFMRWLLRNKCSRPYVANAFTDVRLFVEQGLGKRGVLRALKYYIGPSSMLPAPKMSPRGIAGKVDANGNRIDAEDLILRVRKIDVRAALILQLFLSLGLSRSEAFRFSPSACVDETGDIYVGGTNTHASKSRIVRPELVPRFAKLAAATVEEVKKLCPMLNDTIYRGLLSRRVRIEFSGALGRAGILSTESGISVESFREEYLREAWLVGGVSPPSPIAALGDDSVVVRLACQICHRKAHFLNLGGRDTKKWATCLAEHFRGIPPRTITRAQRRRATGMFADVKFDDMRALESRLQDLRAIQKGTLSVRALEDKILENFLNGTQHRMR